MNLRDTHRRISARYPRILGKLSEGPDAPSEKCVQISDSLRLVCERCGRSMDYDRSIDPDLPAWVATLSQSHCDADGCDTDDRLIETWLDADGVARDPGREEDEA